MAKAFLINRFQQTRPKCLMHLNGRTNYLTCKLIYLHYLFPPIRLKHILTTHSLRSFETQRSRRKDFFSFAAEKGGKRKTLSFAGAELLVFETVKVVHFRPKA